MVLFSVGVGVMSVAEGVFGGEDFVRRGHVSSFSPQCRALTPWSNDGAYFSQDVCSPLALHVIWCYDGCQSLYRCFQRRNDDDGSKRQYRA